MPPQTPNLPAVVQPGDLLTTRQVAKRHPHLSESWLAHARITGDGPPFRKLGRRVLYVASEVDGWLSSLPLRQSTSQRAA